MKPFLEDALISGVDLVVKLPSNPNPHPKDKYNYFRKRIRHGFVFWISGQIDFLYDGEEPISVGENMFVYLPQGREYRTLPKEYGTFILINFRTTEDLPDKPFCVTCENNAQIRGCFLSALKVFRQKKRGCQAELKSIIYMLISLIQAGMGHGYLPNEQYRKLEPAVNYLNENFVKDGVKISELAELCGMSRKYFTKLFTVYYETTPKQYLLNCRIDYARKLLLSADSYPISEIAEKCGFGNIYYFSKLFKQRCGVTPSEYRRNG